MSGKVRNGSPYTGGATLVSLLEERAEATPGRPFLVMDSEDSRTYGRFNAEGNRLAHGLARLGVGIGDHVVVMLVDTLKGLLTTFALRKLGAVEVAIPRRMKGPELRFAFSASRPRLAIVEDELLDRFEGLDSELPDFDLVVVGDLAGAEATLGSRRVTPFEAAVSDRAENLGASFSDTHTDAVLFTSGTTGPAKGCVLSHRAGASMGLGISRALKFGEADCLYCPFPTTLVDSRYLTVGAALWSGARAAIGRRFDVRVFWDEVRAFEATVFEFMGTVLTRLWDQRPEAADLDNPVRLAWGVPPPPFGPLFEERFGLRLATCYGSTDAGVPTWRDPGLRGEPFNSSGRVVEPFEIRIGDEDDAPLPAGKVGEILVRSEVDDVTMKGYLGLPEETTAALRNGWLHTGDLGRLDADGRLYFDGRKVEAIHRRGENVSPWEVEQALEAHPEVVEAVAVAMPGGSADEDICAYLVLKEGSALSEASLRGFLATRIAASMMPRVFRVVPGFLKTETGKPEKFRLRQPGSEPGRAL
ncbi:MAG: AMP-binding protein [Actinobacteria bacterium]|nr:AMP-binding protein [Actinomycetota bacterium]